MVLDPFRIKGLPKTVPVLSPQAWSHRHRKRRGTVKQLDTWRPIHQVSGFYPAASFFRVRRCSKIENASQARPGKLQTHLMYRWQEPCRVEKSRLHVDPQVPKVTEGSVSNGAVFHFQGCWLPETTKTTFFRMVRPELAQQERTKRGLVAEWLP